jgi:hypothetical protein
LQLNDNIQDVLAQDPGSGQRISIKYVRVKKMCFLLPDHFYDRVLNGLDGEGNLL